MTRQEMEALLAQRTDAMTRHDASAMAQLYAKDCFLESPTAGGTVKGRRGVEDVSRAWFKGFPDAVWTTEELLIDGDRMVQIATATGTDTGGFLGLPPTGKPFRLPMVTIFTMKGQEIVHERRIYDFTGMLVQIGVLKAKPA